MANNKHIRIIVMLECTNCIHNTLKRSTGVSRYITHKNRRNTPNRLELNKFCAHCCCHTIHKEITK